MATRIIPAPIPPGFKKTPAWSNFFRTLGKFYVREEPGKPPVYGIHVRPKHANRHNTGHGGFLATLADTFIAGIIRHHFDVKIITTDLALKYLRPTRMGDWVECHEVSVKEEGGYVEVVCDLTVNGERATRCTGRFKMLPR